MLVVSYITVHIKTVIDEPIIRELTNNIHEWRRKGFMPIEKINIRVTDSYASDFINNLKTIVADCEVIRAPRIILKNSRHNRKRVFLKHGNR